MDLASKPEPSLRFRNGRGIAGGCPALVIAEIGQNHNGQLALAEALVDAAAWAGADAIKLVKRDIECELAREARERPYHSPHAFGDTYGQHRAAVELSAEVHAALVARARRRGLLVFATACDEPSVALMRQLDVDALKVASRDLPNEPLLERVGASRLPVFLSTGMSGLAEIDVAVETLKWWNASLVLMQCTSLYPASYDEVNLRSMLTLQSRYGVPCGFSDHTPDGLLAPVAVALGAPVIEKHLTLDRKLKGTDQACSLEPLDFEQMIRNIRNVEQALGRSDKPVSAQIAPVREKLGRSLVARKDIVAGSIIQESMLLLKCPGSGLSWHQRDRVIGHRATRDIPADSLISAHDVTSEFVASAIATSTEITASAEEAASDESSETHAEWVVPSALL